MASVFLDSETAIPASSLGGICLNIDKALLAGGADPANDPWIYAASRQTTAMLKSGTNRCDAALNIVAGDFFVIHPLPIIRGGYLSESDLMHDRVILDEQAAWDLFYSVNVTGQYLELEGRPCVVAAVVDTPAGKYNEMAAVGTGLAWVLSDCPALAEQEIRFTCLEAILPEPVDGFAVLTMQNVLAEALPRPAAVTDHATRFSLNHRWRILGELTTRGIAGEGVAYPDWERAAQLTENHLARRLIPEAVLLLIPAVSLLVFLLWLKRSQSWRLFSLRKRRHHSKK